MKDQISKYLVVLFVVAFTLNANAQTNEDTAINSVINSFKYYKDVKEPELKVPTVLELPLDETESIETRKHAVINVTTSSVEPSILKNEIKIEKIPVNIEVVNLEDDPEKMNDDNHLTFTNFPLNEEQGVAEIFINSSRPISSSSLVYSLDKNVILPDTVQIEAFVDNKFQVVKAKSSVQNMRRVSFPKTYSAEWKITFTHTQPLRITEVELNQDNAERKNIDKLRFLAQPGEDYRIYYGAERTAKIPYLPARNLYSVSDFAIVEASDSFSNPEYVMSDIDLDGVPDQSDNCLRIPNKNQEDVNNNSIGDECDDFDKDGIINPEDNCLNVPNPRQRDVDGDGIGDKCDDQESRFTERYPWTPWVGIGFAFIVIASLFYITARSSNVKNKD